MTKRSNRSRGGLSPSRGPGRGLPAHTRAYSRPRVARMNGHTRLVRNGPHPVYAARKMTPNRRPLAPKSAASSQTWQCQPDRRSSRRAATAPS